MLTIVANFLYPGLNITDEATCYKVFKADVIKNMPLKSVRFEFCPEVTAWTWKRGYKIKELPIKYYPRSKKEGKKIMWTDGVEALWVLFKHSNLIFDAGKYMFIWLILTFVFWKVGEYLSDGVTLFGFILVWFFLLRQVVFKRK